jgi:IclR family acetate operon transcriptional repressor
MGPDVAARHLPAVLTPRTANTLTERTALDDDLALTRERGYAIDDQENRTGIRGYAAPIFDHTGSIVAAVSIGGPADRVNASMDVELGTAVIGCARTISHLLGSRVHGRDGRP